MKRGEIVVAVLAGDYGKPRPALIVQNDTLGFDSVIVCPLTSSEGDPRRVRIVLEPSERTGLRARSDVMTEKITAVSRTRISRVIGRASEEEMAAINGRLAFVLGLA